MLIRGGQISPSKHLSFAGSAGLFSCHRLVFRQDCKSSSASHCRYKTFRNKRHLQNHRRNSVTSSAFAADLLSVSFFTAASAGLVYSAIPLLTGKSKQDNSGKSDNYGETDVEPEGIKWGVMSVVSFIPLVNWTVGLWKQKGIARQRLGFQHSMRFVEKAALAWVCRPGCLQL